MSEPVQLEKMPPASVIYVATFDANGGLTVEAKIHTDIAGRMRFEGDAARAYTLLTPAIERIVERLALPLTEAMTKAAEEKRLLQHELLETPTPPLP